MKRRDFIKAAGLVALPVGAVAGKAEIPYKQPIGSGDCLVSIQGELLSDMIEHCITFRQYYFEKRGVEDSDYCQKVTDDIRRACKSF